MELGAIDKRSVALSIIEYIITLSIVEYIPRRLLNDGLQCMKTEMVLSIHDTYSTRTRSTCTQIYNGMFLPDCPRSPWKRY